MPFDSGAFERRMMHPPMHPAMTKEEFELAILANAPMKLVSMFYGTERNYYEARANATLSNFDTYDDLEVDSYFRLLHHRANSEFDDRVTAVEIQLNSPVNLIGSVLAAILPKPFLDQPGIPEQIERWGGICIPYHVKEEFVPREIQGSIFDRLTEYFEQQGILQP